MKTYAQDMEDVILDKLLSNVEEGFYIDIGANSPDVYSVTKLFYEKGWTGINIEPLPDMYKELCLCRPRDINLNIGIGEYPGTMTLYLDGMGSTLSAMVVSDNHLENNKTIKIEVHTLGEVLHKYVDKAIHFIKIDVEGFERQVLNGMDWNYRPWIFCIESTKPGTEIPSHKEWEYIMFENDYELVKVHGINRYYMDSQRKDIICF